MGFRLPFVVLSLVSQGQWVVDEASESQLFGVSCAYSVGLDTFRTCSKRCDRAGGITPNTWQEWFTDVVDVGSVAGVCTIPVGYRSVPKALVQHSDLWEYGVPAGNDFHKFSEEDIELSERPLRVYRKLLRFDKGELRKLALDPLRLTYAVLKMSKRIYQEGQCTYLHFLKQYAQEQVDLVGTPYLQTQTVFGGGYFNHDPSRGYIVGPCGEPTNVLIPDYYPERESREFGNRFSYLPPITAALQQQLLRQTAADTSSTDTSELIIGLVRSYNASIEAGVTDGEIIVDVSTNEDVASDTKFELEMFSTVLWKAKSSPECAERRDCSSCTVHAQCAWCDMSQTDAGVPLVEKTGWHSQVGSVDSYGSSCGVPPLVCAMMGGTPFVNKCRGLY